VVVGLIVQSFTWEFLSKKFGLRRLVEQHLWEVRACCILACSTSRQGKRVETNRYAAGLLVAWGLSVFVWLWAWQLVLNCEVYRKESVAVETFARFLQEAYDADDLLFLL
jgi:hypothetical protein